MILDLDRFCDVMRRDVVYGPIMQDLEDHGFRVKYNFFKGNGAYHPGVTFVKGDTVPLVTPSPAQFQLCVRHGAGAMAYYFLHEAYHFYQDGFGMFCTPLLRAGQQATMPDLRSFTYLVFLCEAMAATESIRGALRLKKADEDLAWRGVCQSIEWRKISKRYDLDLKNKSSDSMAAQAVFRAWYDSVLRRRLYEMKAIKLWREIVKTAEEKTQNPVRFMQVSLSDVVCLMPGSVRPSYLDDIVLDDPIFTPRLSHCTQKSGGRISGKADCLSIEHGSPVYLWRKSRALS